MLLKSKENIIAAAATLGIDTVGFTNYNGKCAIVCLFPYPSRKIAGANLSLYTYFPDYHQIIKRKLNELAYLISPDHDYLCHVDIGEPIDQSLAYQAGLGFYGYNHLLINSKYGTFFFIGYILCDLDILPNKPLNKNCLNCKKCEASCPGGALKNGKLNISCCASHISQKKGDLSEDEISILKRSGLVFGCDSCQLVCPHNQVCYRPLKEFTMDVMPRIELEDILSLSNKEFREQYGERSFSWRGKQVLIRNLKLLGGIG